MWIAIAVGAAIAALAHTAPAPFLLDALAGRRSVWHMPKSDPPTIYFTYDDGPNPATTPALLDVLAHEGVRATVFLIDRHINDGTAPLVSRMFARRTHRGAPLAHPGPHGDVARDLRAHTHRGGGSYRACGTGRRPCRAFRPHAGWRPASMYADLKKIDHRLVGWSWMLWDWNWFRKRTSDAVVGRVLDRATAGAIVVMHDGDESAPLAEQRHTVEATARLIPALRAQGFAFGTVCDQSGLVNTGAADRRNARSRLTNPTLAPRCEQAWRASHAIGARRRSGARERVAGSPRGEAPRMRLVRR
jgi:peptidoglycan/xylan/chitin deacetylase (PgdA/CDA1 family)